VTVEKAMHTPTDEIPDEIPDEPSPKRAKTVETHDVVDDAVVQTKTKAEASRNQGKNSGTSSGKSGGKNSGKNNEKSTQSKIIPGVRTELLDFTKTQVKNLQQQGVTVRNSNDSVGHKAASKAPSTQISNVEHVEHVKHGDQPERVPFSLSQSEVVVHAKHLCGGATDLALYSLEVAEQRVREKRDESNTATTTDNTDVTDREAAAEKSDKKSDESNTATPWRMSTIPSVDTRMNTTAPLIPHKKVGIATCCHHRCDWGTYVGKTLFIEVVKEQSTFSSQIGGLCCAGARKTAEAKKKVGSEAKTAGAGNSVNNESGNSVSSRSNNSSSSKFDPSYSSESTPRVPSSESCPHCQRLFARTLLNVLVRTSSWAVADSSIDPRKKAFGIKSKRCLDAGRAWYCREILKLDNAFVCNYVEESVSPENGLLVAF
jgi:hypothetical protein